MCFGGGSESTSAGSASASSSVTFNPSITVGSNPDEPAKDTGSTFAKALLASEPARVPLPAPVETKEDSPDPSTKILAALAVALVARKVLRG